MFKRSIYATATSSTFFKTASQLSSQSFSTLTPIRTVETSIHAELKNPVLDAVVALAVETALTDHGALVFCASRQACQNIATIISDALPPTEKRDFLERRMDVVSELRSLSVGLDETLKDPVMRGVAFHHAGLTAEERSIIAEAYDQGVLRVIVATCSLAAGINLPARKDGARTDRPCHAPPNARACGSRTRSVRAIFVARRQTSRMSCSS